MQNQYFGLILGKQPCLLQREYASVAIDVDLSNYDIRPIRCPTKVCEVEGECLDYVSEDCCKGEYWYECDPLGVIAVENGQLWCAESPCEEHLPLCVPTPTDPIEVDEVACQCGEVVTSVRYANVSDKGLEGPLSPVSNVGTLPNLTFPNTVALYVEHGGGWFCQGQGTEFDLTELKVGIAPVSEGWCTCPDDVKFLERHSSGSLMTISGDTVHISHPSQPQLWGKYDICHCRDLIAMLEVNGNVFVFDGQNAMVVEATPNGYVLNTFDDNVCIDSPKQLTTYNGAIFLMTNDGPRSITGSQYNRSIFGYLNASTINPNYFCGDNNWAVGVHGTKMHFSNGENAYIYDLLAEPQYALTESSLVPDDYYTNCDGIYYLVDGEVWEWNPCEGEWCPYTYCTSPDMSEECENTGVMEINGYEFGDQRTEVTVSYLTNCCDSMDVCTKQVCFCTTINITGCANSRGVKTCYTGTDIIFRHNYAKSPAEIR